MSAQFIKKPSTTSDQEETTVTPTTEKEGTVTAEKETAEEGSGGMMPIIGGAAGAVVVVIICIVCCVLKKSKGSKRNSVKPVGESNPHATATSRHLVDGEGTNEDIEGRPSCDLQQAVKMPFNTNEISVEDQKEAEEERYSHGNKSEDKFEKLTPEISRPRQLEVIEEKNEHEMMVTARP